MLQGTVTSCRKSGNKLAFHVDYDDGDAEVEPLGEEGTAFKWHGPRACSGDPPFKGIMRDAMSLLHPQNLQDNPDPEVRYIAWIAEAHCKCLIMAAYVPYQYVIAHICIA
jgi:hypothetical protein